MNTNTKKNKNKAKQNKPQQKTEMTNIEEQKDEIKPVDEKIEVKSDERVPEIVSEVVTQPVPTKDEDTPKKPKRNRGKKKKNEKEDLFDDEEEKKEETSDTKCDPETAPKDAEKLKMDAQVAPTTRKKKNKKDNKDKKEQNKDISEEQREPPTKFEIVADHPLKVTKLTKSEAESIMSDVKIITCVPIPGEGEQDKKKKNKKKKRTDSEKSEKEEVSCISAFQKLLEPRDDKKDTKKVEEKPIAKPKAKSIENLVEEKQKIVTDNVTLDMILKNEPNTKTGQTKDSVPDTTKDDSGKGKKKNKKDKKHTRSESEDECIKTPEPKIETPKTLEPKFEMKTQGTAPVEKLAKSNTEVVPEISPVDKESTEMPKTEEPKSPQPKAKVAKPVQKKNKDFKPETISESVTESEISKSIPKSEAVDKKSTFEEMIKLPMIEKVKEETKKVTAEKEQEEIKITENIQVVESKDKKRKKSPKPQRVEEIKIEDKMFKKALSEKKYEPEKERKTNEPLAQTEESTNIPEKKETIEKLTKAACEIIMDPAKCLETEQKESLQSKAIPLPFTEMKKSDDTQKSAETKKSDDTKKSAEMQKSVDRQKSADTHKSADTQKSADMPVQIFNIEATKQELVPEEKKTKSPKIGQVSEKTSQVCEKTGQVSKKTGQSSETQQFDRIPTPDGGMGKKRRKSPKPQRKHDNTTQELRENLELKEECLTSENITKTVTEDAILKKEEKVQPSPADFKMLKDDISKETQEKDLTATQISTDTDENPGVILLRKLASPLPMIKSSGETSLPKPDIVEKAKSELVKASEKSESVKASEKFESVKDKEKETSESVKDKESLKKHDKKQIQQKLESVIDVKETSQKDDKKQMKPNEGQKTDLKSKMMEVNQDMEGLRKSIEKSLAELSVIDRSEKSSDQQFVEAQSKLQEIKDLTLKQQFNIKEKATLSSSEKLDEKKSSKTEFPQTVLPIKESATSEKPQTENIAPIPMTEPLKSKGKPIKDSSESPKIPEVHIIQEAPKNSEAPKSQEAPKTLETPKSQEAPKTPDVPKSQEAPKPPEAPKTQEAPKNPEVPKTQEAPNTPEPPKRDNKGKSKKKGKQTEQTMSQTSTVSAVPVSASTSASDCKDGSSTQEGKKEDKTEQKGQSQEKSKQQDSGSNKNTDTEQKSSKEKSKTDFEQIENFESALTSSVESVNKSFEMIMNESNENNPEINITGPSEDEKDKQAKTTPVEDEKEKDKQAKNNPVSQPKNLLGHPSIPARSNKMDYKKEKNKTPNSQQAKVKIKDSVSVDKQKETKDTQTENKKKIIKEKPSKDCISSISNENEEYVYKYSFRKVYLPSACQVCKMDLKQCRTPCDFCNLVFYCSPKHKDEDFNQHQALCFAVSTIVKLKDQKHIYANTANIAGHDYRLLRMQMIVSCEKVLQRRLIPCEQEMLLYPRICADPVCREWRQEKLIDCDGCGQISYCSSNPRHFPTAHQRWCKSYALYQKLVCYQQTKGRLDPRLPTRVVKGVYKIPDNMNEVLASLYEEKIEMSDIQYAALTQIATAPLTAAYFHQLYSNQINANYANGAEKKSTFTIHVVGAELQFEADVLNKWELFFLHLRPDVSELRVVLIGADLNPGHLPLDLLGKIKLCEDCRNSKRKVVFDFQDKRSYSEYWTSDFITPDLVCAFNPSIQRSSVFNGKDPWPSTIKCILKQKVPFIITSYSLNELHRDLKRIKEINSSDLIFNFVSEPNLNSFASVRPDRNFISDDEMPLLFKNYCCMVVCGAF